MENEKKNKQRLSKGTIILSKYQIGLKNFSLRPLFTILQMPPIENARLNATPNQPRIQ